MDGQDIDLKVLVGKRVRQLRKIQGWSQSELAFRADMQESYLAGMERADRNVTLDSLARVLTALGVEPIEVFRFGELEIGKGLEGKQAAIRLHAAFLDERSLEEVELIRRLAKDVMATIDSQKKKQE
ncbi:helix-turn-helix domain-containing protein [Cohnella faecalis]|uniref:XRE family transcriptional regulator n=1 Tax=Cohnella faecalis TaxID=2315694 RepID=A0A398CG93_9BACL|nr:helix-turn-helix transcriptional regulator [Cohnella faecalis]RIE01520.1 XRE family transcriptional regulator [Cohnella faecalis]